MKITVKEKEYVLEDLVVCGVAAEEQEITVVATRTDDYLIVYTSDNTYLTKLKKLAASNPKEWQVVDIYENNGKITGVKFKAPKKLLSFRSASITREMTDEQKQMAAERLRALRAKK